MASVFETFYVFRLQSDSSITDAAVSDAAMVKAACCMFLCSICISPGVHRSSKSVLVSGQITTERRVSVPL